MIIAFPDLAGISQDANNVALFEAEKSVNLGSPVHKGQSPLGQSSSEGKDTNGLTPREGKFKHMSYISIAHTLYVFLSQENFG